MAKSSKKRSVQRRHNPMRVPDSHLPKGLAAASESSSKTDSILPIIQKMQGVDAAERKWACVAVSNLIQNDPSTRRLLQGKNIVGTLITCLTDSEEEVIVEAAGALRNLCIDGGYDICAEMYNKSILVPLQTFVPKISTTLSQYLDGHKNAPENAQKLVYEFADNVVTLLWCLSETSNKALNAINQLQLVPFLISFLAARQQIPLVTVTAAAHCLYVLTDDNPPAIADVRADGGYIACLLSILQDSLKDDADPRATTLRVLAAGVLRNVAPLPPPSAASALNLDADFVLPQLTPLLSLSLEDVSAAILQLIASPEMEKSKNLSLKNVPKSDHQSATEVELERLESRLRTVQLALEILTGACAKLPDPDFDVLADEDDEDQRDQEIIEDMSEVEMVIDEAAPDAPVSAQSLPSLVTPLLALIQPTTLSFPPLASPSPHPPTTSALSAIHLAALGCLNNIFLGLARHGSVNNSGVIEVWDAVWMALGLVGTQTGLGQEQRRAVWEAATGVLWGVATVSRSALEPKTEQVQALMALCDDAAADAQLRVKCIGALEALGQNPAFVEVNATIATYLLSMLPTTDPSPAGTEPMLQAVSSLIDIYSDEDAPWDANFRAGGYLARLEGSIDGVKAAVRMIDRRKEGGKELRRRGEEVRDNLIAFVKYRRRLKL